MLATIMVTTHADDLTSNNGSVSLREAIRAVNAGNDLGDPDITAQNPGTFGPHDAINLMAGQPAYALTITGTLENAAASGDLDITKVAGSITIAALGGGAATIDAGGLAGINDRVFHIVNAGTTVTFQNLTIRGGVTNDDGTTLVAARGGGILNNGGNVTLTGVTVDANRAQGRAGSADAPGAAFGGGIYSSAGSLALSNSMVSGNYAVGGVGGFVAERNGGNAQGGGILTDNGMLSIANSTLATNQAKGGDGGGNTFNFGNGGNAEGGGFFSLGATTNVVVSNSTISTNSSTGGNGHVGGDFVDGETGGAGGSGGQARGGGFSAVGGTVNVNDAILSDNTSTGGTGGNGGRGGSFGYLGHVCGYAGGNGGIGGGGHGGGFSASLSSTVMVGTSTISANAANGGIGGNGGANGGGGSPVCVISGGPGHGGIGGAAQGGGVFDDSAFVSLANSTVSTNSVTGGSGGSTFGTGGSGGASHGGGLYSSNASASVNYRNSTFAKNAANNSNGGTGGPIGTGQGGGVHAATGAHTADNTIFGDNTAATNPDFSGTMVARYCLVENQTGTVFDAGSTSILSGDPQLGPLQNNGGSTPTHALIATSPAIDTGDPGFVAPPNNDQRGTAFARVADGPDADATARVDMGAFEFQPLSIPSIVVVDSAFDEDDGNYTAGDVSLRDAIVLAKASSVNTITFASGLAGQPTLLTLGQITIRDPLTIQGLGPTQTTINGQNNSRLFDIINSAGTVTFDRITLTGGKTTANQGGGAILSASNVQVHIQNSTISGNSTSGNVGVGGGILAFGPLTVTNSTISGNFTTGGSSRGGGIFANSSLTITNSTISGNYTTGSFAYGGGIQANGTTTVTNSTITGNSTTGNTAHGGGISARGSLTVANSTITGNSVAGSDGGGVFAFSYYNNYDGSTTTPVTIRNSIVAGNSDLQGHPDLKPGGGPLTLTVEYSLIGDNTGTGLAEANPGPGGSGNKVGGPISGVLIPRLGPLAFNGGPTQTHALCTGASTPVAICTVASPALNAADNNFAPPPVHDQRGVPFIRVTGGRLDMGALEAVVSNKIGIHRSNQFYQDVNGNGVWNGNAGGDRLNYFGSLGDVPLVGDWNGDGFDEIGVKRNNQYYLDVNGNGVWNGPAGGDLFLTFGNASDVPLVGDWDGDGDDQIGVQRGNQFYLDFNSNGTWNGVAGGDVLYSFGNSGDTPLAGDWDGDGDDQIGVHRGSSFYLDRNSNGVWNTAAGGDRLFNFGAVGDVPIVGDWNANGTDDIGVQRGNQFYRDNNGNGVWNGTAGGDLLHNFGNPGDRPLDGRWRPGAPLMAAGGAASSPSDNAPLTLNALAPIRQQALLLWANTGLTPAQTKSLAAVQFQIADLPGAQLGLSLGGTIVLDADAAGYGWFVDPTPADNSEFSSPELLIPNPQSLDLLTAVLHELGHELGYDRDDDLSAMFETLAAGTRRLP